MSMDDLIFPCKKVDGKFTIASRKLFDQRIALAPDGNYTMKIIKNRRTRSAAMNRYYWGVVIKMIVERLNELGHQIKLSGIHSKLEEFLCQTNDKQVHKNLKALFIEDITIDEDSGEIIKNKKTTRTMTNIEFIEYYTPIYQWAAETIDLQIPLPNENFEVDIAA